MNSHLDYSDAMVKIEVRLKSGAQESKWPFRFGNQQYTAYSIPDTSLRCRI